MAEDTKIEWADHTFNPWEGCQEVGPGCDNCYAKARNERFSGGTPVNWGPGAPRRRTSEANWRKPIAWNKAAKLQHDAWEGFKREYPGLTDEELVAKGFVKPVRPRVFCASLADVFDNAVDPQWRADLFRLILQTPHLDWLLLTKRIGNVQSMLSELAHGNDPDLTLLDMMPLPNVWIGATVVNQAEADRDIPKLLAIPAKVRFLSMEPLLGPVDLRSITHGEGELNCLKPNTWENTIEQWRNTNEGWIEEFEDWYGVDLSDGLSGPMHASIDWVIVGGESGPKARPMHPDWARSLRDQCIAAGAAFFFKQWGEWAPHPPTPGFDEGRAIRSGHVQYLQGDGREPDGHFRRGDAAMRRVGKTAAGRLLDGRTWDEFPNTQPA